MVALGFFLLLFSIALISFVFTFTRLRFLLFALYRLFWLLALDWLLFAVLKLVSSDGSSRACCCSSSYGSRSVSDFIFLLLFWDRLRTLLERTWDVICLFWKVFEHVRVVGAHSRLNQGHVGFSRFAEEGVALVSTAFKLELQSLRVDRWRR